MERTLRALVEGVPFDPAFDFRAEAGRHRNGKYRDPDQFSSSLRAYHKLLWSKLLPCGEHCELSDTEPGAYLFHESGRGRFILASDAAIPTFRTYRRMVHITSRVAEYELEAFNAVSYQMGGMMLFPGNRIGRKQTINGARGFNHKIADRLDLTLECVRRHYRGETSPLAEALGRYADFFALFVDFSGYVDFFLLQDLVSEDGSSVRFQLPFDDFHGPGHPKTVEAYKDYLENATNFVNARSQRMVEYLALRQA